MSFEPSWGFNEGSSSWVNGAVYNADKSSPAVRKRALKHLWALVKKEESVAKLKRNIRQTPTRTELVRLFLAKTQNDVAWDALIGSPVATPLWPQMAAVRGSTHPCDSIALCHRLLPVAAENGTRSERYDEAFEIVRAIDRLWAKLGERAKFASELEEIRATYRAKRNFIKLFATLS